MSGTSGSGSDVFDLVEADWPAPANVHAFSTTRKGGISREEWATLNLGGNCGDDKTSVQKNRILLRTLLPGRPTWLKQVHGTTVLNLDTGEAVSDVAAAEDADVNAEGDGGIGAGIGTDVGAGVDAAANADVDFDLTADASITTTANRVCAILTADCLPVVFTNKAGTRVAAAHAGWRGLAEGVLEATVDAMRAGPDGKPTGKAGEEIMAWMGPAIGPDAFEVGRDVYDAFCNANAENLVAFKPHGDKWLADLYTLARLALARVDVTQVFGGEYCTFGNAERFFSYRRDGETGRMATLVWFGLSSRK